MSIYFTSDLHFCHNKEFLYGPRGFNDIETSNQTIVKNWNSIVKPDDEVYVLGDLMLNDNARGISLINKLNGTIHVILGNHDTAERESLYKKNYKIDKVVRADVLKYKDYNFYLSHYPTLTANGDTNKPLRNQVVNLCGHSHTKDKFEHWSNGLIYHVELDAHDNKPVLLEDIIKDIEEKYNEKNKT